LWVDTVKCRELLKGWFERHVSWRSWRKRKRRRRRRRRRRRYGGSDGGR
jgi:hypothetical protein